MDTERETSSSRARQQQTRGARIAPLLAGFGERMTRGTVAGLGSGLVFLIATMGFVTTKGLPAVAPMIDISTIFHGQDKPVPSPENVVVGLVTHLTLAMLFGIGFAIVVVPILKRLPLLVASGIAYGLLLYVINFQILGRTLFPWFTNPKGPNQGFEIFIHAVFGLLLVPFFLDRPSSQDITPAEPRR